MATRLVEEVPDAIQNRTFKFVGENKRSCASTPGEVDSRRERGSREAKRKRQKPIGMNEVSTRETTEVSEKTMTSNRN